MTDTRPRFSAFAQFYALLFFGALLGTPLFLLAIIGRQQPVPVVAWATASAFSLCMVALVAYASTRCSSERLSYREGMLFVTSYMMTGWSALSLVFVMPALLATFLVSVALALFYDLSGRRPKAALAFHRWVAIFYRHRMRQ